MTRASDSAKNLQTMVLFDSRLGESSTDEGFPRASGLDLAVEMSGIKETPDGGSH